jgi:hypothetical protein
MKPTIIVPCAGLSSRFANMRPKWMLACPDGRLMLDMALDSLRPFDQERIVVGILAEHDERYQAREGIRRTFGDRVEVLIIDKPTKGPADTVRQIIRKAGIEGPIFVKDSDSWFKMGRPAGGNIVCTADLRANLAITNVAAKSFVVANEHGIIDMLVEKNVVSNLISCGGYGFESAQAFLANYDAVEALAEHTEVFISHIISYAIRAGAIFENGTVTEYVDVGTLVEWTAFRDTQRTLFVDIDGVVLKNRGQHFPPYWGENEEAITPNVDALLRLAAQGAQIVFVTSRPEAQRQALETTLSGLGLRWHALVLGCHHATRVIVNDFAPTNPYPACMAINLPRNADNLADFLPNKGR